MLFCCLVFALAIAGAEADDSPTVGATVNAGGVTEIFGNSFGRPGWNVTYDYIVSNPRLFDQHLHLHGQG